MNTTTLPPAPPEAEPAQPAPTGHQSPDRFAEALAGLAPPPGGYPLPIRFEGSGREYFRIWIVNLLLTVLTLGVYRPWAKVRQLRYFYGHTLVGGHPLDFHGNPRQMLRGTLLVGGLLVAYGVASNSSPTASLVAMAALAALWPALLCASLRFRLSNTSWRGLRLHFRGSVAGAYRVLLPVLLPMALVILPLVYLGVTAAATPAVEGVRPALRWVPLLPILGMLGGLAVVPWLTFRLKRYQHDHYALGSVQTQLRSGPRAFYGLYLRGLGVNLVAGLLMGALAAAVVGTAATLGGGAALEGGNRLLFLVLGIVSAGVTYVALLLVNKAWFTTRLQNLLWSRTKSSRLRFESQLGFGALLKLSLKNWLLIALTLGLYWPFAAIATTRLRLQSMTVYTRRPPEEFSADAARAHTDASGDVAADLFGVDFGL
jgi:uncharacterized membrane protein YjgN (DUF898 family)